MQRQRQPFRHTVKLFAFPAAHFQPVFPGAASIKHIGLFSESEEKVFRQVAAVAQACVLNHIFTRFGWHKRMMCLLQYVTVCRYNSRILLKTCLVWRVGLFRTAFAFGRICRQIWLLALDALSVCRVFLRSCTAFALAAFAFACFRTSRAARTSGRFGRAARAMGGFMNARCVACLACWQQLQSHGQRQDKAIWRVRQQCFCSFLFPFQNIKLTR